MEHQTEQGELGSRLRVGCMYSTLGKAQAESRPDSIAKRALVPFSFDERGRRRRRRRRRLNGRRG